jgi:hypothetical protein
VESSAWTNLKGDIGDHVEAGSHLVSILIYGGELYRFLAGATPAGLIDTREVFLIRTATSNENF